jgi:hypothetical protein
MPATLYLPEGYRSIDTLDLTKNLRLLVYLNIAGLVLLVGFYYVFIRVALWMRPEAARQGLAGGIQGLSGTLIVILAVIGIYAAVIVLHEAAHGIFLAWFTRTRPVFAFRGYYAYAAAPGWYFPRGQYMLVSLAPLVLLSLLGLAVLAFVPAGWFLTVISFMAFNASGAVGDLAVFIWLLRQPSTCLAYDVGEAVTLYLPPGG